MYTVLEAADIAPEVRRIRISAPRVAAHRKPGQFVILRVVPGGERIPLTIADADPAEGSITLFVQGVGRTTRLLNRLETGDHVSDVAGPLGTPSEIEHYGRAVVVGGGLGIAIAFPIATALVDAGNDVTAIVGGRTRRHVLLQDELLAAGVEVRPCTDDGSHGRHGFVTDELTAMIEAGPLPDVVFAAGPVVMMRAVADVTRPAGIHTIASLNPIMVDGTGMCGGCRVVVGGATRFACVQGPEFDAHQVDFGLLMQRNQAYREFEVARDDELAAMEACAVADLLAPAHPTGDPS